MIKLLRSAVTILIALATVAGLFLALALADLSWLFWCLLGASLLIALVLKVWPSVRIGFNQWRGYPSMVARNVELEGQVLELETAADEATNRAQLLKLEGIAEGRAQITGAILAAQSMPPRIVAIADFHGRVSLVAESSEPDILVGARFRLIVASTNALRGIVQVVRHDPLLAVYFLVCVEPTVPAFWQALLDKVDIDTAPPGDVRLERDVLDPALSHLPNFINLDTPQAGETE